MSSQPQENTSDERNTIVAVNGSLPSYCGVQELVAREDSNGVFLLSGVSDSRDSRTFDEDEFQRLVDDELISPLEEPVEALASHRAVHIRSIFRDLVSDDVIDSAFDDVEVRASAQDGTELYIGAPSELANMLLQLAGHIRKSVEGRLVSSNGMPSREELEELRQLSDLGISAAQFDDQERYQHLLCHGHVLALLGESTRLRKLYEFSVRRRYGISSDVFRDDLEWFRFSLDQRRGLEVSRTLGIMDGGGDREERPYASVTDESVRADNVIPIYDESSGHRYVR